jgi:hypothetical protein
LTEQELADDYGVSGVDFDGRDIGVFWFALHYQPTASDVDGGGVLSVCGLDVEECEGDPIEHAELVLP